MSPTAESIQGIELVKEIALRMQDPKQVKAIVKDVKNHNPTASFPYSYWDDLSITNGYPGILPIFSELDHQFPNEGWDAIGHSYILKIKEEIESKGIEDLSIFGGLAGICFYIQHASRGGTRYQKLLNILNTLLTDRLEETYLIPLNKNLKDLRPSQIELYDLMQGVVGIGLYGLKNLEVPRIEYFVQKIIHALIALTYPLEIEGKEIAGWYIPQEYQFLQTEKMDYPKGNFNLGLSHGICGILALLSIALLNGVVVNGQIEAIERIVDWLKKRRKKQEGILFWKARLSFEEETAHIIQPTSPYHPSRKSWCYGTPGIARSLYLAGTALKNEELQNFATESYLSIFKINSAQSSLPGPMFCHGISGLIMTTYLMARDTGSIELAKQVSELEKTLLNFHQKESPMGFKDADPTTDGHYAYVDRAGILEGSSGVLLTILSLNSSSFSWHFPFAIDY